MNSTPPSCTWTSPELTAVGGRSTRWSTSPSGSESFASTGTRTARVLGVSARSAARARAAASGDGAGPGRRSRRVPRRRAWRRARRAPQRRGGVGATGGAAARRLRRERGAAREQAGRRGGHDGGRGGRERRRRRRQWQPPEDRGVREPGERAHRETEPAERDTEQRTHDPRVELRSGAARHLLARARGARRLLVRARGRDYVEHVGDRDDPPGQRDLLAGEAGWVALAVPPLMVLAHRGGPLAQPFAQRLDELGAVDGCRRSAFHSSSVGLPGLLRISSGTFNLPTSWRSAAQFRRSSSCFGKPQLFADHARVGANPLGVAPGQAVVRVERGDESEEPLGSLGRRLAGAPAAHLGEPLLHRLHRSRPHRRPEARRGPVGEEQRQLEQRGERQQPPRQTVDRHDDQRGRGAQADPPRDEERRGGRLRDDWLAT